jgi:hypothetical protein
VGFVNDQRGIGEEVDLVYAQKIGAFARHRNRAAIRSVIVEGVAVFPQGHARKGEGEIVILPRVLAIDERVVGKTKQHGEMPIPLGPDAIRFHPIREGLLMVRAVHLPEMPRTGLGGRYDEKPRDNREARERSLHALG